MADSWVMLIRRLTSFASLGLFALLPWLSSCGDDCTLLIGCENMVSQIAVRGPDSNDLEPGVYTLGISLGGPVFTATCDLELGECDQSGPDGVPTEVSVRDGSSIEILTGPVSTRDALPETYAVTVRLDGVLVSEQSGPFEFTQTRPNGPGCEPLCERPDSVVIVVE